MATIKSARTGKENDSRFFCEVTLDGADDVVTRASTPALARQKAEAYCLEHYGQRLTSGHFPKDEQKPAPETDKKHAPGKKPKANEQDAVDQGAKDLLDQALGNEAGEPEAPGASAPAGKSK